jgi:glycerophosphoryl diester phosphodiesterase
LKNEVSGRVGLFVEIKHPEDTEKVVKAIHEAKAEKWTAVISFHEEVLKDLNLYKWLVYSKPPGKILEAKEMTVSWFFLSIILQPKKLMLLPILRTKSEESPLLIF